MIINLNTMANRVTISYVMLTLVCDISDNIVVFTMRHMFMEKKRGDLVDAIVGPYQ